MAFSVRRLRRHLSTAHGCVTERLILPPQLSKLGVAGQGWQVRTAVRQSLIPGAGDGRFAEEPVASNVRVSVKPIVAMASLESLRTVAHDATITFVSTEDLERYVRLGEVEGGYTRTQILEVFEHFIWSLDGERAFLNNCTWSMNHADEATGGVNVAFSEVDGSIVGDSVEDILAGDEFRNNYRAFAMPAFYEAFCRTHNFTDVKTAVLEAIDAP